MAINDTTVIRSNSNPYLGGAITLQEGTNITLVQSGQTITISTSGSGVPSLTATQIAYGDGSNLMTSTPDFTYTFSNSQLNVGATETWGATPSHSIWLNDGRLAFQGVESDNGLSMPFLAIGRGAIASEADITSRLSGAQGNYPVLGIGLDQDLQNIGGDFALAIGYGIVSTGAGDLIIGHNSSTTGLTSQNFIVSHGSGVVHTLSGGSVANTIFGGYGQYVQNGSYNNMGGYGNYIGGLTQRSDGNILYGSFNLITEGVNGTIALGCFIDTSNITKSNAFIVGGAGLGFDGSITDTYIGQGTTGQTDQVLNASMTFHTTDGNGTDISTPSMFFNTGIATGAGSSGYYVWATSDVGVSGTTPQTVTNKMVLANTGELTLNKYGLGNITGTPAKSASFDSSGKIIETALSGAGQGVYIFTSSASSIGGYFQAVEASLYVAGSLGTTSQTVSSVATLLEEFATNSGYPNTTLIPTGLINVSYDVQKTAGTVNYFTFARIYKRDLAGTETLIATTDNSSQSQLNSIMSVTVTAVVTVPVTLLATDRIVIKVYAQMASGTATVTLRYDSTTLSRIEFPATSSIAGVTGTGTTNELAYWTSSLTLGSLTTATYPSLTELSYVKGVTSAIQTQLNNKQPLDATLTALAGYNTNGILTQTAADTFVGRTITGTSNRLTVTNGDGVSGNPTLDISASYVGQASITTLGTVTTGTWNGGVISPVYGGTGVANGSSNTITFAGGNFGLTLTQSGTTSLTLPTSGTVATLAGTETLTNKTVVDNTFSIADDGDNTKLVKFQVANVTTGTTRTWTFPNTSSTFVGTTGAQSIAGAKTFDSSALLLRNPGDTFSYTFVGSAIAAARNLTIPLLTGDDTMAVLGLAQTFTAIQKFNTTVFIGGTTAPTALLHLAAGTTAASTAPLKFTTGTSMTAAEAGAMEYTTDDLFFTIATGTARKRIVMADPVGGLTSGRVPFVTTNGRLSDAANVTWDGSVFVVSLNTYGAVVGAGTQLQATTGTSVSARVYRTTNAGSNVTPLLWLGTSVTASGTIGATFNAADGLGFMAANGTRQILRAGINIINLTNTAGSEGADLGFYIQKSEATSLAPALRLTLSHSSMTLADPYDMVLGTTTGTKIGTATTQKLAFFNSTPIVQPANTVAIDTTLVNLGLRATGGNANFDTAIVNSLPMRLKGYTVATLPAGTVGDTAYVTDALAPTFLATVVGGGAVTTPVFYNGTNWVGY